MQEQRYSSKFIRQRKFYTVLPVLALPFLTLFFWAIGGGKSEQVAGKESAGFNFALPDAYLSKEKDPVDKLGFYEQAAKDSAKLAELIKNDPYYRGSLGAQALPDSNKLLGMASRPTGPGGSGALNTSTYGKQQDDPNETRVYKKLDELTAVLNASTEVPTGPADDEFSRPRQESAPPPAEIARLESMMAAMEQQGGGGGSQDPEMQELSAMLEKVLDIQHPERVEQRLKAQSETSKGHVFAVSGRGEENPVTLLEPNGSTQNQEVSSNGFYSLDDVPVSQGQNATEAVVHETQELVNGSTVKLRLVNDVYINGVLIPKDNFLFGKASLSGERLKIQIGSLRYGNSLFPVELAVFDMDGMAGIHVPGAITRDAAKQSGDRAIQSIGMMSMDPSIGAQAASAGIELGRNLLSRKVKLVRVTVKAGYQVLIRDEKQVASR